MIGGTGQHSGSLDSTVASQQESLQSSPCMFSPFWHGFPPSALQDRGIGAPRLNLNVNVNVDSQCYTCDPCLWPKMQG